MITYIPQATKNWLVTPNKRNTFTTLADMTGWCLFENKDAMELAGWTTKFSCDGVTGPTNSGDTTDRWVTKTNASVRGASAASAQSWWCGQNVDGLQALLTFQGATDDIARISISPGGLFTLAGTTTNQPTATDEVILTVGNSIVNATASLDRVMSIFCTNDTRHWRFVLFRAGTMLNIIGVDWLNTFCPVGVFGNGTNDIPYMGFRYLNGSRDVSTALVASVGPLNGIPNVAIGTAGQAGGACRVFTAGSSRLNRVQGRAFTAVHRPGNARNSAFSTESVTISDTPALQGGSSWPMVLIDFEGENTANLDGWLGQAVDWWIAPFSTAITGKPGVGDMCPGYEPTDTPGVSSARANWILSLGGGMNIPWRNAAVTLEQT